MSHLYLSIQTIPSQRPGTLEAIRATVTAPANMSKPETISAWMKDNADAKANELWLKTAYDGSQGEVIAIAWAFDDEPVQRLFRAPHLPLIPFGSEAELLTAFFTKLSYCVPREPRSSTDLPQFVGHNILGHDLRFLFHRAVINQIEPPFTLPHDNRYNSPEAFDTMISWCGFNKYVALPEIATALGIKAIDPVTAGEAWAAAEAGAADTLAQCAADNVQAVREIHWRMTFENKVA